MTSFFKRNQAWMRWLPAFFLAIAIFAFSSTHGDEVQETYQSLEATILVATSTPAPAPAFTPTSASPVPTAVAAPPASDAPVSIPLSIDWLKVGHVIGYFWLGIAVLYGLSTRSRWSPSIALILCSLYAFSDEIHQLFVPDRTASPRDILIDTLAALLGLALTLAVMASRRFFSRRM